MRKEGGRQGSGLAEEEPEMEIEREQDLGWRQIRGESVLKISGDISTKRKSNAES